MVKLSKISIEAIRTNKKLRDNLIMMLPISRSSLYGCLRTNSANNALTRLGALELIRQENNVPITYLVEKELF